MKNCLEATLKKQIELILIVLFFTAVIKHIKILPFQHVVNTKNIDEVFYILLGAKALKSDAYFIHRVYINFSKSHSSAQ